MGRVYSPNLEHTITIPDYCVLCGTETRRGALVWVDEEQYWVCLGCVNWAECEDVDLEEAIRGEVG